MPTNKTSKNSLAAFACMLIGSIWVAFIFFAISLGLAFYGESSHQIPEYFLIAIWNTALFLPGILLIVRGIVLTKRDNESDGSPRKNLPTKTRRAMLLLLVIGIIGAIFGLMIIWSADLYEGIVSEKYLDAIVTIYIILPSLLNILVNIAVTFKRTWAWKFIVVVLFLEILIIISFWFGFINQLVCMNCFIPSQLIYIFSACIAFVLILSDRVQYMKFTDRLMNQTALKANPQSKRYNHND